MEAFYQNDCKVLKTGFKRKNRNPHSWQFRHADGTWTDFNDRDSSIIDDAHQKGETKCVINADRVQILIDLELMVQCSAEETSGSSSRARLDRESPKYFSHPIRRWQDEWTTDPMLQWNARIREIHPTWDYQTSAVQTFIVDNGTTDYIKVEDLLFNGGLSKDTYEICRVVRVQNIPILRRYENEKQMIGWMRKGGECPPEKSQY